LHVDGLGGKGDGLLDGRADQTLVLAEFGRKDQLALLADHLVQAPAGDLPGRGVEGDDFQIAVDGEDALGHRVEQGLVDKGLVVGVQRHQGPGHRPVPAPDRHDRGEHLHAGAILAQLQQVELADGQFLGVQPVEETGERGDVVIRGEQILERPAEQLGQRPAGDPFGIAVETGDEALPVEVKDGPGVFGAAGFRGQEVLHGHMRAYIPIVRKGGGAGEGRIRCTGERSAGRARSVARSRRAGTAGGTTPARLYHIFENLP
jgi:hypothetical protein